MERRRLQSFLRRNFVTASPVVLFQPRRLKDLACEALKKYHGELKNYASQLTEANSIMMQERGFRRDQVTHNPDKFKFNNGLQLHKLFELLVDFLKPRLSTLYIRSANSSSADEAVGSGKLGRPRHLSHAKEFYLTLMFLCHALSEELLADMFGFSSKSQVSYILSTWIRFFSLELAPF